MKSQKYNLPCGNRIVQCGIRQILYLELMAVKGWGVRTKYDIPKGTFISTYSAKMYTSIEADEVGKKHGDTFLCDLDYIEVAEKYKGEILENILEESAYETEGSGCSDVELQSQSSHGNDQNAAKQKQDQGQNQNQDQDQDRENGSRPASRTSNASSTSSSNKDSRQRNRSGLRSRKVIDEVTKKPNPDTHPDDQETGENLGRSRPTTPSRKLFEVNPTSIISKTRKWYLDAEQFEDEKVKDEICDKFVLDAMSHGNVGRFFNHSCDPNMAITNTFTYTQDMRFPVLGFFTIKNIRAGDELTWCYGDTYQMEGVDTVKCVCGAPNCSTDITFKRSFFMDSLRL